MSRPAVVLDACALIPIRLATTMLWLAEAGLFQPLWSEAILDEVERTLPKLNISADRAHHRVAVMRGAFGAEAMVDDFDDLIEAMRCDAKDRHVLAAAVRGGADMLVTFNLKDFPPESAKLDGIEIRHPDRFLVDLLDDDPDMVSSTLRREIASLAKPPQTHAQFLTGLQATVPTFAARAMAE